MYINQTKIDMLEQQVAPSGSSRYVALFHKLPAPDGAGFVEANVERLEVDTWQTELLGEYTVKRSNVNLVGWDPLADYLEDVVGWGLFTASSGGTLKAASRFRDSVLYTFKPGEEPRFQPGELALYLDPAPIDVDPGSDMDTCTEIQTFDDTPAVQDLGEILDTEAKHLFATVQGDGFDGDEGKHYYRQFQYSFIRDDGGSGIDIWQIHEVTPDAETRNGGLTSAVAVIGDDGSDTIRITVTGETDTSINWKICWKGIGEGS